MSLWFQPPSSQVEAPVARGLGFGQVRQSIPAFLDQPNKSPQQTAAAGGITQMFNSPVSINTNLGDTEFNFDGPYFNNNSLSLQHAINNNVSQTFNVSALTMTIEEIVNRYVNVWGGGSSSSTGSGVTGAVYCIDGIQLDTTNNASAIVQSPIYLNFENGSLVSTTSGDPEIAISISECE